MPAIHFDDLARRNAETLIELALAEDLGTPLPHLRLDPRAGGVVLDFVERPGHIGDLTSETTVTANGRGSARFVARSSGVIAGMQVLELLARRMGLAGFYRADVRDGDRVDRGAVLAHVAGEMRAILALERTALNFLQRLSGVATLTAKFVDAVAGTRAQILDTRKTTPGWRFLEKYAVRCGGGTNHRVGLYDAVLIKDNHLAWLADSDDPIGRAVGSARAQSPAGSVVEVEVDSLSQLDHALACQPDIVLVDNFVLDDLAEAVRRRDLRAPAILLEASGGVDLSTVRAIAQTCVDRISVGALTHSAPALDIALDYETDPPPPAGRALP